MATHPSSSATANAAAAAFVDGDYDRAVALYTEVGVRRGKEEKASEARRAARRAHSLLGPAPPPPPFLTLADTAIAALPIRPWRRPQQTRPCCLPALKPT